MFNQLSNFEHLLKRMASCANISINYVTLNIFLKEWLAVQVVQSTVQVKKVVSTNCNDLPVLPRNYNPFG